MSQTKNKEFYAKLKMTFKRISLFFSVLSILAMLAYPIFSILTKRGNLYINIAVLTVTSLYALFWLIFGNKKAYKIDRIFKWSKLLLNAVSLGVNAYAIYVTATNFNFISMFINFAMGTFFVFNVIFNILYDVVSFKLNKFMIEKKDEIDSFKLNLIEKKNEFLNKKQNQKSEISDLNK